MKKLLILFILPFSIGLGGCKKSPRKIIVSGRAIDETTCKPIENAHLVIASYTATGAGYAVDVLDETYSDAHGNYKFEIKNSAGSEFHIVGKAQNYYETDKYKNSVPEVRETNNLTIKFTPKAHLKLNFFRKDPSYTGIEIAFSGTTNVNYNLFVGDINPDSASVLLESKGNQENVIEYVVFKYVNATVVSSIKEKRSFYSLANDTSAYSLYY